MCASHISGFRLGEFTLYLKGIEEIKFNRFPSATLRGAFGTSLKSTLCIHSAINANCEKCLIKKTCTYYYLFETGTDLHGENNPHPFVILLPLELANRTILPGEIFSFHLVLFGYGLDYLPHIIYAFENLGKKGLGSRKGKFDLVEVKFVNQEAEKIIYFESDKILNNEDQNYLFEFHNDNGVVNQIKINLLTPLRMKNEGRLVTEVNFKIFIINLLRRISKIAEIHCGEEIAIDWSELLKIGEETKIISDNTYWKEYKRFSSRQKQEMLLGGLLGNFEVQGKFRELLPYLYLGEIIHVGKSTSFGFGKYQMQIIKKEESL